MKTHKAILALALLSALGCDILGDGLNSGKSRSEANGPARGGSDSTQAPGGKGNDTTVYLAAVKFGDDYDWQRDTAYGATDFDIILYKDFSPYLTIRSAGKVGISPDPDSHHIIGGHLYSCAASASGTTVFRDGKKLLSLDGRCLVKGIYPQGGDLWTLAQKGLNGGFALRKNSEVVVLRSDGVVYGGLSDPSCPETGALYSDEGEMVFCCRSGNQYYLVRDGKEEVIQGISKNPVDIKRIRGTLHKVTDLNLKNYTVSQGSVWKDEDGWSVSGTFTYSWMAYKYSSTAFYRVEPSIYVTSFCADDAFIYHDGAFQCAVLEDSGGYVKIYRSYDKVSTSETPCHLMSASCAAASGGRLVIALTPRDKASRPYVLMGGEKRTVDVYGYISAIAVDVSPAS